MNKFVVRCPPVAMQVFLDALHVIYRLLITFCYVLVPVLLFGKFIFMP